MPQEQEERYQHPGWLGEPYKSDFQSKWGLIALSEILDCSHLPGVNDGTYEAKVQGFQYFLSRKPSKYGSRLYKVYTARCSRCIYGELVYQERNAKTGRKHYSSIEGRMSQIVRCAKDRAKKRGMPFNLDTDDIIRRTKLGVCEATGLPLDLSIDNVNGRAARNPFTPSLDRVDSNLGYTQDNVQVVCLAWNLMKSNFDGELLERFRNGLKADHR